MALAGSAVVVLGMCVYLLLEVRKPASAQASSPPAKAAATEPEAEKPDEPAKAKPATPTTDRTGALADRMARVGNKPAAPAKSGNPEPEPARAPLDAEEGKANYKLDAVMTEANKAYDRMEFDEARSIASKVLVKHPTNSRMLRIMVSAACIENDAAEAQKHYNLLPDADRQAMKTRCSKYGITFTDPPK